MRLAVFVLLVASSSGFAQQRNLNPIGSNGNILNPGIPLSGPPAHVPAVQAVRPQGAARPGHRPSSFSGGAIFVPYPVGNAASGYTVHNPAPGLYDPIFGGYTPTDSFAAGYPPQMMSAPTPMVVINQNFLADPVRPQFRDYSNVQLPEPGVTIAPPSSPAASAAADDQPVVFLIAMRDHTIVPAVAYWLQGDTLNYITLQGAQNQVSISLVDRDFSKQLNAERNVPFRLPAAQ
jgi:hypothetical protein